MSIRIGLAGCGDIVKRYYLPALMRLRDEGRVRLAACCDVDMDRAEGAALLAGFEGSYTDCIRMMRTEKLDAVVMAVPVEKTAGLAMKAASFGIPMMLEKPPALTAEEGRRLDKVLKENKVLHQIAFNRHFIPVAASLREKLRGKRVQNIQIQMCRIRRLEKTFYTTAVHCIDLLRFLSDAEYEQVRFSYQDLPEYGSRVSNFFLDCRFGNGVSGQISILVDSGLVNERIMAVCSGTSYYASLPVWECGDSPGGILTYQGDRLVDSESGPETGEAFQNAYASGFYGEIRNFLEAVDRKIQPEESMEYAIPLIEIAQKLHNREEEYRK